VRPVFLPYLFNGLSGDPGLWVDLFDEGRSVLLDLGDLRNMPTRKILRVERIVVTHTHMDHFIGFDHVLRVMLGREKELTLTGPPGFIGHLRGKLEAYTWNLIEDYPIRLIAEEVDGSTLRSVQFSGSGGLLPEPLPDRRFDGTIHAERLFTLHVDVLDHGIPVLAAALRETEHIAVNKDRLVRLGLRPGEWLRDLKHAARRCLPGDAEIGALTAEGGTRVYPRGELIEQVLIRSPGQRIGYVTDLRYTPDNVDRVVRLVEGVDLLVCEAPFLHEDDALARARCHLTARQCGEIARAAGARRLAPFHFSPRYHGREPELLDEVRAAFGGKVLELSGLGETS
jgi:ribonuclease Z